MNLVTEKVFVLRSEKQVFSRARKLRIFRRFRFQLRIDPPQHSLDPTSDLHHRPKQDKILSI